MASPPTTPPARRRPRRAAFTRSAFTLIELMISIALVVILILGVNQVFQSTLQAVGAGQAFVASIRDGRAAQTTFGSDLNGAANDGPFFIIHSAQTYAFRNRADLAADKDQDASTYTLTTPDDTTVYPSNYTTRNHRLDVLEFFARGLYPAQTGDTSYVYPIAASEARVWYGFLKLPDGKYLDPNDTGYTSTTSYQFPGLPYQTVKPTSGASGDNPNSNPNNFFATDWVLGRVATLLLPLSSTSVPPTMPPAITSYFSYRNTKAMWTLPSPRYTTAFLSPLDDGSKTTDTAGNAWFQRWSRLNVAQTSISNYAQQLSDYISDTTDNKADWYNNFAVGTLGPPSANNTPRQLFQCNPFVTTATATTTTKQERVARTTPYFLKGCTQFIVEFAGDFVQQNDDPTSPQYGYVTDLVTTTNGKADGIDYQLIPDARPRSQWARRIRWYGLPRNVDGTTTIPGNAGTVTDATALTQVVPLGDVVATSTTATATKTAAIGATTTANGIERSTPTAAADYSGKSGMAPGSDYLVAWGPDSDAAGIPRPKMIRITITLDDPSGRLPDGQTYQFVYTLPRPHRRRDPAPYVRPHQEFEP